MSSLKKGGVMIEERLGVIKYGGTNLSDGYIYLTMTPSKLSEWAFSSDPMNLAEIQNSDDRSESERAMEAEIASLLQRRTFVEIPLPPGRKAVNGKRIFK
ncbi:Hypothetical protein PHPALM_363 [Phytophthora palmivora]|uniref:Uncharacterized protein n=1 Tax=Phytophthora palmivora TaxID=4796 RepID=A0A2P4YV09_9STRA|nr:Hypothetical protein PHPALM_363 [Phytophthora palmivora]